MFNVSSSFVDCFLSFYAQYSSNSYLVPSSCHTRREKKKKKTDESLFVVNVLCGFFFAYWLKTFFSSSDVAFALVSFVKRKTRSHIFLSDVIDLMFVIGTSLIIFIRIFKSQEKHALTQNLSLIHI